MRQRKQRGRKDHYTPQGYLRGFIDPARSTLDRPLWYFDLVSSNWTEKSTAEVGWERGFYDPIGDAPGLKPADVAFAKFEREFPLVREHLLRRRYKGWVKQHRSFLLSFMQMLRARSPLFFQQQAAHNRSLRGATITAVGPGNQVTLDSLEMRALPESFVRNSVIGQMHQEIQKGPDWMLEFNWCLRYTTSTSEPFVTGQQGLAIAGPAPSLLTAMQHPETLIFFPICWQACLVGSRQRFDKGTDEADPSLIAYERSLFRRPTEGYLISPQPLSEDAFGQYTELRDPVE